MAWGVPDIGTAAGDGAETSFITSSDTYPDSYGEVTCGQVAGTG